MKLPVQITLRDVESGDEIEALVRKEAAWLERYHKSIMSCRVIVERPHKRRGGPYHVRIDLTIPGHELVVKHEPSLSPTATDDEPARMTKREDIEARYKQADLAVRDAFHVARRRLEDAGRRQRGDVKTHAPKRNRSV